MFGDCAQPGYERFAGKKAFPKTMTALISNVSVLRAVLIASAVLIVGLSSGQAQRVHWSSSLGADNRTSTGKPMDGGFYFELGVFKNGFVPTANNTEEWAANWEAAHRVKYHDRNRWFTSVVPVTNNAAPFTAGAAAYIWGFKGTEEEGEWILMRANNWTWPAVNAENKALPTTLNWTARNALTTVVGSVEMKPDGTAEMRSAAVGGSRPPKTEWEEWRRLELEGRTHLTGAWDDADGDGVPNILEFLHGTSPLVAGERPRGVAQRMQVSEKDGRSYLEVRVPRRRDRPVEFIAEVSDDLVNWTSGSSVTSVVEDDADALTVRDRTPIGEAGPQRFMRVNIAPK